jgi:hypothetical protein
MYELVFTIIVAISVVVIHALRSNKHQEKDQTINEKELWPVEFYLLHEPRTEKDHEWFVATEKYFEAYDARLLTGIGRKEAWRILALALRTNNAERVSKNSCQAYRINGFILKNKESKFLAKNKEAKFIAKNGNGKLVSVAISQNTAFRILARAKKNIS